MLVPRKTWYTKMMEIIVATYKWMLMITTVITGGALLGSYYVAKETATDFRLSVTMSHIVAVLSCRHSGNHTQSEVAEFTTLYVKICTGSIIVYASLG